MASKPPSLGGFSYLGSYLPTQIPPAPISALNIIFLDNGTGVAPYGKYQWSDGAAWNDFGAGTGGAKAGLVTVNATDITASRALAAADFGAGTLRINSAAVVAITLPTVAAMGLAATAGQARVLAFEVLGGGIPTFAGATASTTINGTAGPATVLPLGGAPVTNGFYVLVQQAAGSDAWSLS